jgi:hypothetical protein
MMSDYGNFGAYGFTTFSVPIPNAPLELTFPTSRADLEALSVVRRMENGNTFYCVDERTEKVMQSVRVAALAGSGIILLAAAALPSNRGGLRTLTYLAGLGCLGWQWTLFSKMRKVMETPEAVVSADAAQEVAAVVAEADATAGYGFFGH